MMHPGRLPALVSGMAGVFASSLLGLAGCGGAAKEQPNPTPDHLRKILQAFDLANYEKRRGPNDADELRSYLKQVNGVDDPDELLLSPNDNQPYEIVWGVNLLNEENPGAVVAYEQKGVSGKRYVITAARVVKEMSDAEFSGAAFATGKKARKKKE